MEQYTTEGIIELAQSMLEDDEESCVLYFTGEDEEELEDVDWEEIYSHFEDMGYTCYMEAELIEINEDFYGQFIAMKKLVIAM